MTASPAPGTRGPDAAPGPVFRAPIDAVVAQLTARALLGRRRAILLAVIPALMIVVALIVRWIGEPGPRATGDLMTAFSITIVVPLVALIAGTGAIGPEVDDGSILYLLAKPLSRYTIASSKYAVAAATVLVFAVLTSLVAGLLVAQGSDARRVAVALTAAAAVAGLAYTAAFLALSVFTRMSVVIGLLYVLVWESLVGGLIPGAQRVSVRQWSLAVGERVLGSRGTDLGVDSPVGFVVAVGLLAVVTIGSVLLAGWRLRSARLTSDE